MMARGSEWTEAFWGKSMSAWIGVDNLIAEALKAGLMMATDDGGRWSELCFNAQF